VKSPPEWAAANNLDEVLTIKQVAKRAGWSISKMRRFLVAKNNETGGALLFNAGLGSKRPRWTITLRALKVIAPQWFFDPEAMQRRVEYLTERIEETRENVAAQGRRLTALHQVVMVVAREHAAPTATTRPLKTG
jgi:hypothetical protein